MFDLDVFIYDAIKSLGNGFSLLMKSLTVIGKDNTYFLVIIVLIWCINFSKYSKLTLLVPFSGLMASALKLVFHMPRPRHIAEGITVIDGYGMPSGHALSAVAFWSYTSHTLKKRFMWVISILMILGIGISRIYRDSHFPSQVLAGFLLGTLVVVLFIKLEKPFHEKFFNLKKWMQYTLAAALPIVFVLMAIVSYALYSDGNGIDDLSSTFQLAGLFTGFAIGMIKIRKYGEFDVKVVWWKQLIKLVACGVSFALYPLILKYSCKLTSIIWIEGLISVVISFFAAMWFVYYAPILFIKFKLVVIKE
ncbi:MAG: phosphatase PAP2 family protein [Clostridia bacterium]|nr:phosphatase PAP2 family protein [Clostridia bacterium]